MTANYYIDQNVERNPISFSNAKALWLILFFVWGDISAKL